MPFSFKHLLTSIAMYSIGTVLVLIGRPVMAQDCPSYKYKRSSQTPIVKDMVNPSPSEKDYSGAFWSFDLNQYDVWESQEKDDGEDPKVKPDWQILTKGHGFPGIPRIKCSSAIQAGGIPTEFDKSCLYVFSGEIYETTTEKT